VLRCFFIGDLSIAKLPWSTLCLAASFSGLCYWSASVVVQKFGDITPLSSWLLFWPLSEFVVSQGLGFLGGVN